MTAGPLLRPELWVEPWQDSVVEAIGFEPTSTYVETCCLPLWGPTSTLLYRRLGSWAIQEPEGFVIDTVDLARSLGLGEGTTPNSPLARSIGRLAQFNVVNCETETLAVRRAVPPLTERMAAKLPASAAAYHRSVLQERAA